MAQGESIVYERLSYQSLRLSRCWKIVPENGSANILVTDHNGLLVVNNEQYTPVGGWQVTSRSTEQGTKEIDASGHIDGTTFTYDLIRTQVLRNAKVYEYQVDWKYPWKPVIRTTIMWIGAIDHDGETFRARLTNVSRFLQGVRGKVITVTCPLKLFAVGDFQCNASMVGHVDEDAEVSSVVSQRKSIYSTTGMTAAPERYVDGILTWKTGANAGWSQHVKTCVGTEGVEYTIEFQLSTPYDIEGGDTFDIEWGCDRLIETCDTIFDNRPNFGAEPHIPGSDIAIDIDRSNSI